VATLRLATKKPWAIDRATFTPVARPLYLTTMAIAPTLQRRGLGRQCLVQALSLGRAWPAQSLCLDAYDAPAGAGEFYRRCGFREVGRATYRGVPLLYFESLL
jgi:GNAT superfamily N-acetyltransferase